MAVPGLAPSPAVLRVQGRAHSEQSSLKITAVADAQVWWNDGEALHEDGPIALKRSSSLPVVVPRNTSTTLKASAKPSFRIQLPSLDIFTLANTFSTQRRSVERSAGKSYPSPAAERFSDSSFVNNHATTQVRFTPLSTPPDEKTANLCIIPSEGSEQITLFSKPTAAAPQGRAEPMPERSHATMEHTELATSSNAPVTSDNTGLGGFLGPSSSPNPDASGAGNNAARWADEVMDVIISELDRAPATQGTINVVAQTIPAPVADGISSTPTTALPALISALQSKLQNSSTPYIRVTHAVPSSFALTNLPTSPPGTPSVNIAVNPQDDYFSSSVFSSAVAVMNRHDKFSRRDESTPVSSSPCLAVPPGSTDFSLLERYIPPSTSQEFSDLFLPTGPSALVDRLIELSPNNGNLLFVYPTRAGAERFRTQYLNPILDPILRSVITSHCLSADIGINIGKMGAIEHLLTFEVLKRKISLLLKALGRGTGSLTKGCYSLVHARNVGVLLPRKVWSEWYVKQESPRIRHITTEYINRAIRLPQEEHVSYAVLTREIVEGIVGRGYGQGEEPGDDSVIEVGLFVIRRGD